MLKLELNASVVVVPNATLEEWQALHDSTLKALSDEEQEVDMERIGNKIQLSINRSHAAPAYNDSAYDSEVDYLGELLHKAKLAPYRDELLDLLHEWMAGDARISVPLKRIEELIDMDVLSPDVLLLQGDYDHHYPYD